MSIKPNLHITMPPRRLPDYQRGTIGPRSPRFHEDFDAPFSEAIMNASLPATTTESSSSPTQERPSMDESIRRISPGSSLRTPSFPEQSPGQQWREYPWNQKSQRKPSVNNRVRGWARRSIMFKSRPTSPDEPAERSLSKAGHTSDGPGAYGPK